MDGREVEDNWYLLWQREAFDLFEWTGQCGGEDSWIWACLASRPTQKMRLARWSAAIPLLPCLLLPNSGPCLLLLGVVLAGGWCPLVPQEGLPGFACAANVNKATG